MKCPSCGHHNLPGIDACERCQTSLTQEDVRKVQTDVERNLMKQRIESLQPVEPLTVAVGTSLTQAIQLMRQQNIGCVVVSGDGGKLAGILTERDLLQKVAGKHLDHDRCRVEEFMSPAPESSKAEHPLAYALHRMIISDIRYLPLVDENDRPAGIISSRDVIAYINAHYCDS